MVYGEFVGRDGLVYSASFDGEGLPHASITLSNIVISMDAGERKFVGFKTTSCKISVVTDTDLTWAYTESSTGISVVVTNDTDGVVVFSGYVVPFSFEQPVTGCADTVTIDCVDDITAHKNTLYVSLNEGTKYGVDERGIDIVRNMARIVGENRISQIVVHKNFDWDNLDEIVLDTKVAQAGFLQDKMTALEAMNAVCVFFGFTAHMVGNKLYLYDEYCLTHAAQGKDRNAVVEGWELDGSGGYIRAKYYDTSDSPFREVNVNDLHIHKGVTLSVERAYDGIQATPSGSDTSILLPNVCDEENVKENTDGRGTEPQWGIADDSDEKCIVHEWRKPVESKVMDLGETYRDGIKSWVSPSQVFPQFEAGGWEGYWETGAQLLSIQKEEIRTAYMGFQYKHLSDPRIVLWIRDMQGNGLHRMGFQNLGYSHTGGYVELKVSYKRVNSDSIDLESSDYGDDSELKMFHMKFGNRYFLSDYANGLKYGSNYAYKDSLIISEQRKYWDGVIIIDRGAVMPTSAATAFKRNAFAVKVDTDEQITLEIGVDRTVLPGDPLYHETGIVISRLEILGYGDEIDTSSHHYRREFASSPRDILEVDAALTSRDSYQSDTSVQPSIGVNARPGVVPAKQYSGGGYMGDTATQDIVGCGILMEQLAGRYNAPHNRYTMTVDGYIQPFDKIAYNGVYYTVEGYERDLANNTTLIIIN